MSKLKRTIGAVLSAILLTLMSSVGLAASDPDLTAQSNTAVLEHKTVDSVDFDTGNNVISMVEDIPVPVGNLNQLGDLLNDSGSVARIQSAAYSTDYYGSQLPQTAYSIYKAIKSSELWNGPTTTRVDLMGCLSEDKRTITGTIIAVGDEDGEPKFSCEPGSISFTNMVHAAATALVYDHPDLSWLVNTDASAQCGFSFVPTIADQDALESLASGDTYELECKELIVTACTYGLSDEDILKAVTDPDLMDSDDRFEYANTGQRTDIEAALQEARTEIGPLTGETDSNKVLALHDWLCNHTNYADKTGDRFVHNWRGYQTAYSALVEKVTVCAGYSKAFKLLCDAYGIPCVIVCGYSQGESHAWNYVMLGGRWYGVDTTWADQDYGIVYADYLKGSQTFNHDHENRSLSKDFDFAYPVLATMDYDESIPPLEPSQPLVPGDSNLDSVVNLADLARLAHGLNGTEQLQGNGLTNADLNANGMIDIEDLTMLAAVVRIKPDQNVSSGSNSVIRIQGPAGSVSPGQEISVTVTGTGEAVSGKINTSGLTFVSTSSVLADSDAFTLLPDFGTLSITYTYRVNAESGKVSLTANECFQADATSVWRIADASWSAELHAVTEPPTTMPSSRPDSPIPTVEGYQGGRIGNTTTYSKISGSSTMFYLTNPSGRMERVAVPYVKDGNGKRWYPINHGGTALFPRLENNQVTCYCIYQDGMEIPVLNVVAVPTPAITDGYQTGTVGSSTYYVKASGSSVMFYLRNGSGKMERVAVPYVKDSSGKRWYPVNHGGTVLFPELENGLIASYRTGSGETVLLAA